MIELKVLNSRSPLTPSAVFWLESVPILGHAPSLLAPPAVVVRAIGSVGPWDVLAEAAVLLAALALTAPKRIANRHVSADRRARPIQHFALPVAAERLAGQHRVLVQGNVLVRLVFQTMTVATPKLHKNFSNMS